MPRSRALVIEHAAAAYLPPAPREPISHYVLFEYPPQRGFVSKRTEEVPCYGLCEAQRIQRANERLQMQNVRIVSWAERHPELAAQRAAQAVQR